MTTLLEQAFERAAALPPEAQNSIAHLLMAELESQRAWDAAFVSSGDQLAKLAAQALEEDQRGETTELDPRGL